MNELKIEEIISNYLTSVKISTLKVLYTTKMLDHRFGDSLLYIVFYDDLDTNNFKDLIKNNKIILDQSGINYIAGLSVIIRSNSLSQFLKNIANYVS